MVNRPNAVSMPLCRIDVMSPAIMPSSLPGGAWCPFFSNYVYDPARAGNYYVNWLPVGPHSNTCVNEDMDPDQRVFCTMRASCPLNNVVSFNYLPNCGPRYTVFNVNGALQCQSERLDAPIVAGRMRQG